MTLKYVAKIRGGIYHDDVYTEEFNSKADMHNYLLDNRFEYCDGWNRYFKSDSLGEQRANVFEIHWK